MTAESTVPSPGGRPRAADHGYTSVSAIPSVASGAPVSVIPRRRRGAVGGLRFPSGRRPFARRPSRLPLPAVDIGAALAGGALALPWTHPIPLAVLVLAVLRLNAHASLYRAASTPAVPALLDELPAVCARIAVGWCALAALLAAYSPGHALSARALVLGCAAQSLVSCAGRGVVHGHRRRAQLRRPRAALVVGRTVDAQRVAAAFLRHPGCGVRPVGVVADETSDGEGLPVLTTGEEVQRALIQNGVQDVLAVGSSAGWPEQASLLRALGESGCAVWEVRADSSAYGRADRLAGFACRRLSLGRRYGSAGKRLLDVLVSGVLLLLVSPVLLVCAIVLRAVDGPGVVFRQERIGKDGRPFTLLKFRTHRPVDAHEAATRWSVANEHEMVWFCRFLRRTSLDELLQLWNVLRGDMSLVGPRPERPFFVGQFSQTYPGYAARHRMRTGITGLAQIHGLRGDTSIEDRCRFDNAYIDDWSLWQDLCILARTAVSLVRPTGS
ncbi:exopolysaccharide biosynthesis polyprenyl glycosylphosphotransferase [Streptomyces ortus]|uniref:Exopolysaccharide biosynthesis polyprenyl glycosylphosphotransferase n=1 Tax=Streptomyces ortus TaxID=2867268 RepID=A0ABT3VAI2_9ACTN|nr:exopolysaccharide biosynthesis polyprenyl glycosylphosphotransferase [Streptomyces ortus]MCX4236541.1 exopolysaccharide biosynthesis polyprenyl glycosylphosphotransferase [Streptomyces ortus]